MFFAVIILNIVGLALSLFGYLIFFKKKNNLVNGFKADYKADQKDIEYAKRVGLAELILGLVLFR